MKSLFSRHFPITMLCLAVAWSCSNDDDASPQNAVGAATGSGGSGGSAALGSNAGSGGASATGVAGGGAGEMGGSNGLAQPGMTSNSSGMAQGGGAGSSSMADAGGSAGAGASDAGANDAGAALVTYTKDIQPILVARCSPCHSTDRDGRHNAATSYADAVRVSADIVREISSGGMPESGNGNQGCNGGDPGEPGCVTAAEFALIQRWIADGTPQ